MSPLPPHYFLIALTSFVGLVPFLLICFGPERSNKESS